MNAEQIRLEEAREQKQPWKQWGPYLSEREWGTVREDYSDSGNAWDYFTHDQARSRAYHWGEDGLAGISDDRQRLCFALALWSGKDPIIKERLFGLTNSEGNHGEDVKEYYFYLDSTPTHSYMNWLYKYPQAAYPYDQLVKTNRERSRIFVDVGQIVAGYSQQAGVNVGGTLSREKAVQGNFATAGGQAIYTDRPTITYVPLTGNKFIRSLMTPLSPESVFFTIQSGWPADSVLFATVASINGLKNQESSIAGVTPPDPEFLRALELLRKIQLSEAVSMRIQQDAEKQQTTILTLRSQNVSPETLDEIHELRRLLRLDPDADELKLVFAANSVTNNEVEVITRSMMQQIATMASQVEVPPEDVTQGRAAPGWDLVASNTNAVRLIRIKCSKTEPADAFVAVEYRSRRFWIDDRDLKSKRVFSFMMMLFTLADTGEKESLPLITIPAQ